MTVLEPLPPLLDRPGGHPGLRALALFHAAAMVNRFDVVEQVIPLARERGVSWTELEEAALQVVAYAGFPRAIETLGRLAQARGGPATAPCTDERAPDQLDRDGRDTWNRIYATNQDRVLAELDLLLPGFDGLVLRQAYGRILSRPGLALGVRELLAVGALAVAALARPLESHIRGALANGFAATEVRDILLTCAALAADDARAVIEQASDRLNRKVYTR